MKTDTASQALRTLLDQLLDQIFSGPFWGRQFRCVLSIVLVGIVSVLSVRTAAADETPSGLERAEDDAAGSYCIRAIRFIGLERTKRFVLDGELDYAGVQVGKVASSEQIEFGIQKLRNLGVFREVLSSVTEVSGDAVAVNEDQVQDSRCGEVPGVRLAIQVDEKWTALPIFSFSSGGGTYRLILGAYDVNFLGRYIKVGAQYERLGDTNSFYGSVSPRRLFGRDLIPFLGVGSRNRVYRLYNSEGLVDGGFLLKRFSVEGALLKRWSEWFRTTISLRYENDDFSLELLGDSVREQQRARGLPGPSHALILGAGATLGQLNIDSYLVDGATVGVSTNLGSQHLGSTDSYRDLLVGFNYFRTLPLKSTLGFRLAGGTESTDAVHRRFFLGGLDAIRGFRSDRYNGSNYWLSTLEFRIPSVDSRWFLLQHIFFVDAAGVSDAIGGIATLSGASTGIGLRIIVPKIQDFVVRIDYAFPLYGEVANPLGFGGGQFF